LHRLQLPVSAWRVSKLAQLPYNLSPRIASALAAVESGAALTRSISPALGNEA
jgi:hypothetical protein